MSTQQDGDVFLFNTPDGGDICAEAGVIEMRPGIATAAYISLFGGNEDDDGGDGNPLQWWGNYGEDDAARKIRSETQHLVASLAAVPANLKRVEDAAKRDLAWMVDTGLADNITAAATMPALNTLKLTIGVDGITLDYTENWGA